MPPARSLPGKVDRPGAGQGHSFLLEIAVAIGVAFGLTWFAARRGWISRSVHRRLWHMVLLLLFLFTAVTSVMLALEYEFGIFPSGPPVIARWHVSIGFALVLVLLAHVCGHLEYYMGSFMGRASKGAR